MQLTHAHAMHVLSCQRQFMGMCLAACTDCCQILASADVQHQAKFELMYGQARLADTCPKHLQLSCLSAPQLYTARSEHALR